MLVCRFADVPMCWYCKLNTVLTALNCKDFLGRDICRCADMLMCWYADLLIRRFAGMRCADLRIC